jgi:hypothetical protein
MRLYRSDRPALERLIGLQTGHGSSEEVLHPRDHTQPFSGPDALAAAYASRTVIPLPSNPAALHLTYDLGIGGLASRLGVPQALYRGLRPAALDLLVELAARVHAISGSPGTLVLAGAVSDDQYRSLPGAADAEATDGYSLLSTGYAFEIARRYASAAQAAAFQAMLDRLQALNLIAWAREPATIHVTVAADASKVIVSGP